MQFTVKNNYSGKTYPAKGSWFADLGWHYTIYDFAPNAWGSAEKGIGTGPVLARGWRKELEEQGWIIPERKAPENVKSQELQRLGSLFGTRSESVNRLVSSLLDS